MLKKIVVVVGTVAAAVALFWALGSRTHHLTKPPSSRLFTPPPEFEWTSEEPVCSQAYVRPAVDEYLRGLPPGARVLDLGCGNGAMLGTFLGRGWRLVGVDISKTGIEQARKRWPDIDFQFGDATEDLSALGAFDAIYSTEVIEHVVLPRRFAQNLFRLLKPGGLAILSTPYHGWLKNVTIAILGKYDSHHGPLSDWGHIKFWSPDTLARLLWEAGLEDIEYRGTGRVPYLWKSMVMVARKPKDSGERTSRRAQEQLRHPDASAD
ncbi:MAG: class I SAM-dependent methyltransferase [Deltaproteobacteria bacterium]|nr:class I SAM-dependent methyltransferase [Deltaproteobacteria bacterium]